MNGVLNFRKLKYSLPYLGLPVVGGAFIALRGGHMDGIVLLWGAMLLVFGYHTAVYDIKTQRIPNKTVLAMLAAWVITIIPLLFFKKPLAVELIIDSALGFTAGGGLFLLVYIISRKGLGGGDVKFIAAAGLYLGIHGVIPTIFCGTVLAALTGLTLMLLKKIGRKDTMPLSPFLYIGILVTVFLM